MPASSSSSDYPSSQDPKASQQNRLRSRLAAKLPTLSRPPGGGTPLATAREDPEDAQMAQPQSTTEEGLRDRAAEFAARVAQSEGRMDGPPAQYVGGSGAGSAPAGRNQQTRPPRIDIPGSVSEGDRDRRMAEMESALNQMMRAQNYGVPAFAYQQIEAPPPFDGSRARSWLRQIEQ